MAWPVWLAALWWGSLSVIGFMAVPLLFASGPGSEVQKPLAVVVIGGLITSTALSLLVVPVVFVYVSKFERRVRGLFAGGASQDAANQAVGTAPADGPAG